MVYVSEGWGHIGDSSIFRRLISPNGFFPKGFFFIPKGRFSEL